MPADPTFLEPCTINILMVGDDRINFSPDGPQRIRAYSLSLMIEALHERANSIIRFCIHTAYRRGPDDGDNRSNGAGAQDTDFTFSDESLKDYDQVWLFGNLPDKAIVIDDEQKALEQFMERGGGVFATGDHMDLGAAMSKNLPRVKSMRIWRGGPSDIEFDPSCHNTLTHAPGSRVAPFEADATPQRITPKLYNIPDSNTQYPHPLLCKTGGVITVLPDHQHEGDCPELKEEDFDGVEPLMIAFSKNITSNANDPQFGAIGAYDGHLAGKGRVVVDASFHHFVNINLEGFLTPLPGSNRNLIQTDMALCAYEDIKTYFRNIAIWLAPTEKQKSIFARALWETRWRSRAYPLLLPKTEAVGTPELSSIDVKELGEAARDALSQLTSRCFVLLWSIEAIKNIKNSNLLASQLYPWRRKNESLSTLAANPAVPMNTENAIDYIIGGAMVKLAVVFPKKEAVESIEKLEEIVSEGAKAGLKAFRSFLEVSRDELLRISDSIAEVLD